MIATATLPEPSYRTIRKRRSAIRLSPENLELYNAIDRTDREILKLAESIKVNGLHEPLIVTEDNFLVSGHRRFTALGIINQVLVPCRVLPVRRDAMSHDEYVALLRDHNRQRYKDVAEQVRETLIDIDPEEAHQALRHLRTKSIYAAEFNGLDTLHIEGEKHRCEISDQKADHVKYALQVVNTDRREYWPLSVRAVHYALLNYAFLRNIPREIPYKNDDDSYQATSDLLTRMRLNGDLPWNAFDDGTRPFEEFPAFDNVRQYVRQEIESLFTGYWRKLLQTQPNHIEVLCEKNTIYSMAMKVTEEYRIPTSSARGFNSIDPWHDLYLRFKRSKKERLIVIIMSDYDPEGEMIPQVGGRTLRDDFDLSQDRFSIIKAGVTLEQIREHSLPSANFAKESSSNYDWFVNRNGGRDEVYELEALEPHVMLDALQSTIDDVIDLDLFNQEVLTERDESAYIKAARKAAMESLKGLLNDSAQ
ncbi:MAG: ParB/Srx family N-terminal domain-containing protein [Planctomycetota bacterium]|nr:ParB/Srx family N-terminal domain-containing protein [Planctomycetota bacterium]